MLLAYFCFLCATGAGLIAMGLGIWMSIAESYALVPAHAHLSLLGWVTLMLYGLYHRGVARTDARLAWAQVLIATAGVPLLSGGLALYMIGKPSALPVAAGGALTLLGMLLFLVVLALDFRDAWRRRP